jgi:tetratricopeptide (TPR) repeat protein
MDNSTQYEMMRYIDGEMTENEKAEFEKRLSEDVELKKTIDNLQLTKEAVKQYGLKEEVAGIHQQMMRELRTETPVRPISNIRRIIRYSVAVAASVLLVFFIIEGYKFYTLSPQKLYADNYIAYELTTTRDGTDTLTAIEKAYKEKKYAEVISLNKLSVLTPHDKFLTGMAYLETMDYPRAVRSFQLVLEEVKDDKTILKDVAEYYLALAYLQDRDYDQAIELMNAIQNDPSHLYKAKFSRKYINRVKRLKWR